VPAPAWPGEPSFQGAPEGGAARTGFQWRLWRERWIAPGGLDGSWGLAYGITDRLELSTPGYLRYAFGDPEALVRPEFALGLGLTHHDHDAERGSTWGGGVSASARRRIGANLAVTAGAGLEVRHESRTGEDHLNRGGAAGAVWDVPVRGYVDLLSLGLEVGYVDDDGPSPELVWVGGRRTPLVTVHLLLLDVALTGGVGWDGEEVGALVGFEVALTL
jgi:hypothetical protein